MSDSKKTVIIAASPKPPGKAASDLLANIAAETLRGGGMDVTVINARRALASHTADDAFKTMAEADALLIVFPLYIFCLPGITMRFLQMYKAYADKLPARKQANVYSVVNCGFPEPEINEEASRVIGRFAQAVGARYRFGILIGGGGMISVDVPPARRMREQYIETIRQVKSEIAGGGSAPAKSVCLRIKFPRKLYFFMGNMGWRRWIRKNGKRIKNLYARPYQPAENT